MGIGENAKSVYGRADFDNYAIQAVLVVGQFQLSGLSNRSKGQQS
jgi:hypothetical protein